MIKAVLFDFYGVIQTDEVIVWTEKQIKEFPDLRQAVDRASSMIDLDEITLEEYYEMLAAAVGRSVDTVKTELEAEVKINHPLLDVVDELRDKSVQVGILSNDGSSLRGYLEEHDIARHFDDVFVSGELGIMKPDPRIYQHVADHLKLDSQEILFFDDRQANVDGALKAGMRAKLYTSVSQVRQVLSDLL